MERIKAMFRERNVQLPDEMIAILYQQVQNTGMGQIEQRAFEAWKSTDMRQLCPPSPNWTSPLQAAIRPSKKNQPEKILQSFILQINSVRDISRPAYQQLQKVINRFNENTLVSAENDNQPGKPAEHGNRMLMVNFTDGKTEIQGMEYHSVLQLRTDTPPGTKVRIIPPITCRRGTLLLSASNIQVIGGSVPALEMRNMQKRILATKLNMTEEDLDKMEKANPPFQPGQARAAPTAPGPAPRAVLNAPAVGNNRLALNPPPATNRPPPLGPPVAQFPVRAAAPLPQPALRFTAPLLPVRAAPPTVPHPVALPQSTSRSVQVIPRPSAVSVPLSRKSVPSPSDTEVVKQRKRQSAIEVVDLTEDSNNDDSFDVDGDAFLAAIPDHWGEDPDGDAFLGSINLDELEMVEDERAAVNPSYPTAKRKRIVKKTKKS